MSEVKALGGRRHLIIMNGRLTLDSERQGPQRTEWGPIPSACRIATPTVRRKSGCNVNRLARLDKCRAISERGPSLKAAGIRNR